MREDLQNKLYQKYPKLFRHKDLPMQETCMCCGICTGDGWYNILDALCSEIQAHCNNWHSEQIPCWYKSIWNGTLVKINNSLFHLSAFLAGEGVGSHAYTQESYKKRGKWPNKLHDWAKKVIGLKFEFKYKKIYPAQVEFAQIKEKFGGLCVYYDNGDDFVRGLVSMAEAVAAKTCEKCGKDKDAVICSKSGWLKALCPECRESRRA
jgi:hypothetical protein